MFSRLNIGFYWALFILLTCKSHVPISADLTTQSHIWAISHKLCLYLGTKLRELMLKNNQDFGAVEMELKKFKTVTMGQRKAGQWVTKHHLMSTLNWTKNHVCKHKLNQLIYFGLKNIPFISTCWR